MSPHNPNQQSTLRHNLDRKYWAQQALYTQSQILPTKLRKKTSGARGNPKKGQKVETHLKKEKQIEDQLIQCKARIAMLEDINRDYKNTINLLRSQLEVRNMDTENSVKNAIVINHSPTEKIMQNKKLKPFLTNSSMK